MAEHASRYPPGPAAYNGGCRCDDCRRTHRQRCARVTAALRARPREDVPHGTYGGYTNWGCRCEACTQAHNTAQLARTAARNQRAGRPLTAMQAAALASVS